MRLADFIARDMNSILAAWDNFAATLIPAAADMDAKALRDHAEEILRAVIKDIGTPETSAEQIRKSEGRALRAPEAPQTAAETHAFLREQSGFDINQMASEYRTLRASVLHLWAEACRPDTPNSDDMVRFNEAIDQALAESVAFFGAALKQERNLLLGMLGHDMRNPLDVILLSATYLAKLNAGDPVAAAAARIAKSGDLLRSLLDDLIDFNRMNLRLGLHIAPVGVNLAELFAEALEQLRASHPGREIELQVTGDARGVWDPHRLHRLLGNLVLNALKYGAHDAPLRVVLVGKPTEVEFSVHNRGAMIEPSVLKHIFEPFVRGRSGNESEGSWARLVYCLSDCTRPRREYPCAVGRIGDRLYGTFAAAERLGSTLGRGGGSRARRHRQAADIYRSGCSGAFTSADSASSSYDSASCRQSLRTSALGVSAARARSRVASSR